MYNLHDGACMPCLHPYMVQEWMPQLILLTIKYNYTQVRVSSIWKSSVNSGATDKFIIKLIIALAINLQSACLQYNTDDRM